MEKGIGLVFLALSLAGCSWLYDDFLYDPVFQARLQADQAEFDAWLAQYKVELAENAADGIYPVPFLPGSYLSYDESSFENYLLRSELQGIQYELQQMNFQQQMRDIRNMFNYQRY